MIRLPLKALVLCTALFAAERPVPPPGVPVSAKDRTDLETGLSQLRKSLDGLRGVKLLPDVQIYHDAVRYALEYNEFFKPEDIAHGKELLRQGQDRADALARGQAPWSHATGLVVRGYVSKIDRSVQPYGLVVPPTYSPTLPNKWRLDAWFHGRGETLSEVSFLYDRQRLPGEFTPPNAFVLHLYGRYCNANKFAGEVDLFEALDAVKRQYDIDPNRILVRGFSMGGAAAWQFGAHFAGEWAAAAPGAGFSETADFLKVFQKETVTPTWWEQKLWHMYDATDYAVNFFNLPLVAYSGEIDNQKQAADIMAKALAAEGMPMTHIIGPDTPHRYHPDSKVEINRRLDAIAERGRDPYPRKIRFTTFTLAYNKMKWVTVDALEKHWERARLDAEIVDSRNVLVASANVGAFSLEMASGACPLDNMLKPTVTIDGQNVTAAAPWSDRSWSAHFRKTQGKWAAVESNDSPELRKRHGLQGPVDDAFLDSFLIVRPTGTPSAPGVASWVTAEMNRAIVEWRRQFRGEAQVRDDSQITDDDMASSNLALWGDPGSNKVLARIADRLPVSWTKDAVAIGKHKYPSANHAPILIYPNPLNPKRYVVLNSGFTFREYDYLNNARQIPKIGDYAVVDTTTPPGSRYPGKLVLGGFFGERWEVLDSDGK